METFQIHTTEDDLFKRQQIEDALIKQHFCVSLVIYNLKRLHDLIASLPGVGALDRVTLELVEGTPPRAPYPFIFAAHQSVMILKKQCYLLVGPVHYSC